MENKYLPKVLRKEIYQETTADGGVRYYGCVVMQKKFWFIKYRVKYCLANRLEFYLSEERVWLFKHPIKGKVCEALDKAIEDWQRNYLKNITTGVKKVEC